MSRLSTKCKYGYPYHVHFDNLNIISRPSDICAEQIKTIDQSRLEQYLGNVGKLVMEEVDKALLISLGINGVDMNNIVSKEEEVVIDEPQATITAFQYMGEQFRFWQDIDIKISLMRNEMDRLDEEIFSVLNYIENTNYNAAQGYRVYKVLREKQAEKKTLLKEIICMESLIEQVDTKKLALAFQEGLKKADEKIKTANKITFVKELMDEPI